MHSTNSTHFNVCQSSVKKCFFFLPYLSLPCYTKLLCMLLHLCLECLNGIPHNVKQCDNCALLWIQNKMQICIYCTFIYLWCWESASSMYCVCMQVLGLFMCYMLVHWCVFVYMCVCLCPSEYNGPWRQASVHQHAAGISALPKYRWTTGAWQQAPPFSHRTGWVYVWLCVHVYV